jgi:hypothetical protein
MKTALHPHIARWLAAVLLLSVWASSSWRCVANADAAPTGSYEDFVQRGVSEFEQGHWEEAHAMFWRAHALQPNARTFRGIGMSAYDLRRYVESSDALTASLSDAQKPLTPEQRAAVTALLQRAQDFVVAYRVELTPPQAELSVDGQPATLRAGQLFLDAGTRVIVARAAGYLEQREQVRVVPGATSSLVFELRPKEATAGAANTLQSDGPTPPRAKSYRPWTWGLAGAAVAAGATGLALGIVTVHKHDDLARCNRDLTLPTCGDGQGPRFELATNASLGVAGGLGAAAIVAFFVEGRHRERGVHQARTSLVPLRHGILLHTTF